MCVHITKGLMGELAQTLGVDTRAIEWATYKPQAIEILTAFRRTPPIENTRVILFSAEEARALNLERVELAPRGYSVIRCHIPRAGQVDIINPRDLDGQPIKAAPVFYVISKNGAAKYALPVQFVDVVDESSHKKWRAMVQLTNPKLPETIRGSLVVSGNPEELRSSPDWAMGRNEEELLYQNTPDNPFED